MSSTFDSTRIQFSFDKAPELNYVNNREEETVSNTSLKSENGCDNKEFEI
jgi:hypothetical protein